jgi:indolepyruvate ferredoxin oxidoreductase
VEDAAGVRAPDPQHDQPLVPRLSADLQDYQSARYAARFTRVVDQVAASGHAELTEAVARHLHKLMAYKDEYEVARLLLLPESQAAAEAVAGPGATVRWKLHPPVLRTLGMQRKLTLGRWARPIMLVLRALRGLRGTPLDVFGWAKVRRVERAMIDEYVTAIETILPHVTRDNVAEAVAIASLPDSVRGYEHLKMERTAIYRAELSRRVQAFCGREASAPK